MTSWDAYKEAVRERADIVEIISEYTPLKRKGRDFRGTCPFHGGKNPNSFSVDPAKGFYRCFADCGEEGRGDIFTFIMKKEGVDFKTACRILGDRYGIQPPRSRKRLSNEERARSQAQERWGEEGDLWTSLGIEKGIQTFRLGTRAGAEPLLLIPVWGEGDWGSSPGGWLTYVIDSRRCPSPRGLDELSREGLADTLFLPPGCLAGAKEELLLFTSDPAQCVLLYEKGYHSCFSSTTQPAVGEPWLTLEQATKLRERSSGRVTRVGLLVPLLDTDKNRQNANYRALHATEVELLGAGIEPIFIAVTARDEAIRGWGWAQASSLEEIRATTRGKLALDVFDLRVSKVRDWLLRGAITPAQAIEKIVSPLRQARLSNTLLYECYVAWALSFLSGVQRPFLEAAVLRDSDETEAIEF